MRTLRKRLTCLYTCTTGLILLLVMAAFLVSLVREARHTHQEQFLRVWNSLEVRLRSSNAFSHSFLARTETDYQMIIHIRENGTPLLYPGAWTPGTSRDLLIFRAAAQAEAEGVYMDQPPVSSAASTSSLMEISGDRRDRYYAMVLALATPQGVRSICALSCRPPALAVIGRLLPELCLLAVLAMGCLWLVSWQFVGWSLKPVEESRQKQARFLAAASHELRSPLAVLRPAVTALAAYTQTEAASTVPPGQARQGEALSTVPTGQAGQTQPLPAHPATLLSLIDSECTRMSRLVDDMLLLASADARTWSIQWEEVDMDTLLIGLLEAFQPVCQEKGITLHLQLPDQILPPVTGDSGRLHQLLAILLDNAISFTPSGRSIWLTAQIDRKKKNLALKVIDEGCGVPLDARPYIFDRFYQADPSRSRKQHFGLGLSIAKELAELHNGSISLTEDGAGRTCFVVVLPWQKDPAVG